MFVLPNIYNNIFYYTAVTTRLFGNIKIFSLDVITYLTNTSSGNNICITTTLPQLVLLLILVISVTQMRNFYHIYSFKK